MRLTVLGRKRRGSQDGRELKQDRRRESRSLWRPRFFKTWNLASIVSIFILILVISLLDDFCVM